MTTIRKTDANPAAAALLTWLGLGCGHMVVNGQSRKWVYVTIAVVVGAFFCVLPGFILKILSIYESYQTAVRLQAGEEIGENEYSIDILYKIMRIVDSTATFKG